MAYFSYERGALFMNIPACRMSTWDIPHVPPSTDPPPVEDSLPTTPENAGENISSQESPSAPLTRMSPGSVPTAQVRFLNAVTQDSGALRISTGNRLLSSSLAPGSLSEYFTVAAGFRPFSFHDAVHPWMLLFRSTIPLPAGDVVTLALVRSGTGVDLVRVDDRPCGIQGTDRACLRCIDLVHSSPGLDLILTDGRVVFTNIRFKEATNSRRAIPGRYDLYIAQTPVFPPSSLSDIETVEELPAVVADWAAEPLASFFLDLRSGEQMSVYLLGDWAVSGELQVLPIKNF